VECQIGSFSNGNGTETKIIHRSLVNHEVSETTCVTHPCKTSYQARFVRLRAPRPVTKPTKLNDDLRHLIKHKVSEPTCLTDFAKAFYHASVPAGGIGVLPGSWCLAWVLGLTGVLVSCWGLGVLLGSWRGLGGLATTTRRFQPKTQLTNPQKK
jgi:hypothetical protein